MAAHRDARPVTAVEVTLRSLDAADKHKERTFILEPSMTVPVGRASKSAHKNLRSSADNAYIDSPVVSRDHAVLMTRATTGIPAIYIRDLGSMHGTAVNNHPLKKETDFKLTTGDVLQFGTDVVRDAHTFVATKFHFASKPYISTSTYALPDTDGESEDISEDDNSDVSDDDQTSSVVAAYSPSEPGNEIQPATSMSSSGPVFPSVDARKCECLGSQGNPLSLADDDTKPSNPVVIDLDADEDEDNDIEEAHVPQSKSTTDVNQNNQEASMIKPDQYSSVRAVEEDEIERHDDKDSTLLYQGDEDESNYDYDESPPPATPSAASTSSPYEDYPYNYDEDDDDDNEYGSNASINDAMSLVAATFDAYSENGSESSEDGLDEIKEASSALIDLADVEAPICTADESDHPPTGMDPRARAKMLEMLDCAQRNSEEDLCSRSNLKGPETPVNVQEHCKADESNHPPSGMDPRARAKMLEMLDCAQRNSKEDLCSRSNLEGPETPVNVQEQEAGATNPSAVLPTPPTTLNRPFESLRPAASMSLKNIMHQEKDDKPTSSLSPFGKIDEPKAVARHPWDWSYSYDNPWNPTDASPRDSGEPMAYLFERGDEDNFALTSSRFDNPYIGSSHPYSVHDRQFATTPVSKTSLTSEQSPLPNGGSFFAMTAEPTSQNNRTRVSEASNSTTVLPPLSQKQKERTGMSIPEIVEPTTSKEDEPVKSKKRKLVTMQAEDAAMVNAQSTAVTQKETLAPAELLMQAMEAAHARPVKRMRLRKTATAMAGILVGTVSAVGALAFLPDVFFQ